jgi:hypothetical protein
VREKRGEIRECGESGAKKEKRIDGRWAGLFYA